MKPTSPMAFQFTKIVRRLSPITTNHMAAKALRECRVVKREMST